MALMSKENQISPARCPQCGVSSPIQLLRSWDRVLILVSFRCPCGYCWQAELPTEVAARLAAKPEPPALQISVDGAHLSLDGGKTWFGCSAPKFSGGWDLKALLDLFDFREDEEDS